MEVRLLFLIAVPLLLVVPTNALAQNNTNLTAALANFKKGFIPQNQLTPQKCKRITQYLHSNNTAPYNKSATALEDAAYALGFRIGIALYKQYYDHMCGNITNNFVGR